MKKPTPKRKRSKHLTRVQYGAFSRAVKVRLLNETKLVACPQCKQMRQAHHACPTCGTYKGRQVLKMKTPGASGKVTKIKA